MLTHAIGSASTVPLRYITDERGVRWTVWATIPKHAQIVRRYFEAGWLTFDSGAERRRLAPIPREWETMTDERLRLALRAAQVILRGEK